jgi:prolyl oligopeptidase
MRKILFLSVLMAVFTSCEDKKQTMTEKLNYPETRKDSIVDNYHGESVSDPYRWLEFDTAADVEAWVKAQNELTFGYLGKISSRDRIRARIEEFYNYPKYSLPSKVGKYLIYMKNDGLQNQSVYYIQEGDSGTAQVLLDPNAFSKDGTVSISILGYSKDKRYMAYTRSEAGSDWRVIKVMDLDSRTDLKDELKWVKFSGAAWDKQGFYYSCYDAPAQGKEYSGRNEFHKVYYHKLGDPQENDRLVYEDRKNALRYHSAGLTEDLRFLLLYVSEGTDGYEVHYQDLQEKKPSFKPLFTGFASKSSVIENVGDQFLVLTNINAPNYKVVQVDPKNNSPEKWQEIVPQKSEYLEGANTAGGKLFTIYLKDATNRVYMQNLDGSSPQEVKLPGLGTAYGFSAEKEDKDLYYAFVSFLNPSLHYKFSIASGSSTLFRKSEINFDAEAYEVKQEFFNSKDGTKVPMFIVHKKGLKMDGKNPTLLYGYGGFNISLSPFFDPMNIVLLENGGIYALANLRGGGEYGEDWHKAGMLEKKQNVFDDFIAAAEHLFKQKYTSPDYLAIEGGSNGGLLVGACMLQRPELYRVAFPQVGVLDMLRFHKFTVGWGWIPEYGSSDTAEHYTFLKKYSPLHNIKPDVEYPSTMIFTADHDDRVVPAHSFKFAAQLQATYSGNRPMLIRIQTQAGHGAGKPTRMIIQEDADKWAFMFAEMGLEAYPGKK